MRVSRVPYLAVLLIGASAIAAPPATPSPIRFPEPAKADPSPVFPGVVARLNADEWFVVTSEVPAVVLTSPEGVVSVTEEAGPVKLKGRFANGGGKLETRTYSAKQVFTLEAVTTGRVEIIAVPTGFKAAGEIQRQTIDVVAGQAPQPPPAPEPGPDPKPRPTPNTLADAAWVVVVHESSAKTPEFAELIDPAGALRVALKAKGVSYRDYDKDSPDLKSKNYLQHAPAAGIPFVLVLKKDGAVLRSVPATAAELDKIARGQ